MQSSCMNIDEFFNNILFPDEDHHIHNNNDNDGNQLSQNPNTSSSMAVTDQVIQNEPRILQDDNTNSGAAGAYAYHQNENREQVSFSLPHHQEHLYLQNPNYNFFNPPLQGQISYGKMTFDEYLMVSGMVRMNPGLDLAPPSPPPLPLPPAATGLQVFTYNNTNNIASVLVETEPPTPDYPVNAAQGDEGVIVDKEKKKKKRERTSDFKSREEEMEKKRKRRIKNRESAAKSRLRKQEYNNQLETEIKTLRAENTRLQNHLDFVMKEKNEEMKGKGGTKRLRRSSSCS